MFQDGSNRTIRSPCSCQEGVLRPNTHAKMHRGEQRQHNLTVKFQSRGEFYKEHSFAQGQTTISQELSSPPNRRWHTRQEASRTARSKPTPTLTLWRQAITEAHNNLTKQHWFHPLSFQQFQALLTLFSKSFSSFPHGTYILSVSNQYSAWVEIYQRICAPIPRNVTHRKHAVHGGLQMANRTLTLKCSLFQAAWIWAPVSNTSWHYNSKPEATISILSLSLFIRNYWGNHI